MWRSPPGGQGIAGSLLRFIRLDALHLGLLHLYLLTDHEGFYERYGWRYLSDAYAVISAMTAASNKDRGLSRAETKRTNKQSILPQGGLMKPMIRLAGTEDTEALRAVPSILTPISPLR